MNIMASLPAPAHFVLLNVMILVCGEERNWKLYMFESLLSVQFYIEDTGKVGTQITF